VAQLARDPARPQRAVERRVLGALVGRDDQHALRPAAPLGRQVERGQLRAHRRREGEAEHLVGVAAIVLGVGAFAHPGRMLGVEPRQVVGAAHHGIPEHQILDRHAARRRAAAMAAPRRIPTSDVRRTPAMSFSSRAAVPTSATHCASRPSIEAPAESPVAW
jgi:hypothetical protein